MSADDMTPAQRATAAQVALGWYVRTRGEWVKRPPTVDELIASLLCDLGHYCLAHHIEQGKASRRAHELLTETRASGPRFVVEGIGHGYGVRDMVYHASKTPDAGWVAATYAEAAQTAADLERDLNPPPGVFPQLGNIVTGGRAVP